MRRLLFFILLAAYFPGNASAEILKLNSGREVRGGIVEQDAAQIRLSLAPDVFVTYYRDEIAEILPEERSFLWRASPADGTNTSSGIVYLFGSVHLGKKDMYPLSEAVEKAFANANALAVEVNIEAVDPAAAQALMAQKAAYRQGDRLENHIPADLKKSLAQWLQRFGMPLEYVAGYKPWFAAMTLTLLQIKDLGFDEAYGVDRYFLRKAGRDKRIIELESLEQQLAFLAALPDQNMFLAYTLEGLSETEKMFKELLSAWENGDASRIEKMLITDVYEREPALRPILDKVIFERNILMSKRIGNFLQTPGVYFVVVGAAHLVGEKGIISLLRSQGYVVEQL